MAENIEIVVKGTNKSSKALNKVTSDLKKVAKETRATKDEQSQANSVNRSTAESWAMLATGINQGIQVAKQVGRAIQQAYQFMAEGAALEYAESKFNNLAQSIGTTADVLMTDLREATGGLYSDAQLMASAGDFMALGLAKTHDEAVRLSAVASALGMNMNQLVLTLTNQTTMRFDALGVSVDGFEERVKALEEQGMSTNEAFNEAFLQQAEAQIEKVGTMADSSMGAFMKFEASIEDTEASLKKLSANAMLPLIEDLGEFADLIDTVTTGVEGMGDSGLIGLFWDINSALSPTYIALENLNDILSNLGNVSFVQLVDIVGENNAVLDKLGFLVKGLASPFIILNDIIQDGFDPDNWDGVNELADSLNGVSISAEEATTSLDEIKQYIEDMKNEANDAGPEIEGIGTSSALAAAQAEMAFAVMTASLDGYYERLREISDANRDMLDLTIQLSTHSGEYADEMEDLYEQINDVTSELEALREIENPTAEQQERINELNTEYLGLKGSVTDLQEEHTRATNQMIFDLMMQKAAVDDLTTAEYNMLLAVGEGLGVIESGAASAAMQLNTMMDEAMADGIVTNEEMKSINAILQELNGQTFDATLNIDANLPTWLYSADENLSSLIGASGGGGGGSGGGGGDAPMPSAAGRPYRMAMGGPMLVGEVGPEPFFPATSGRILSNHEARQAMRGGGGGQTIVLNYNVTTPVNMADRAFVVREMLPLIKETMREIRR